jgi:hypothetical protein
MDPHLGQAAEPIREKSMPIRKWALSNPVPKAKSVPEFGKRAFQGLSAHYFRYLRRRILFRTIECADRFLHSQTVAISLHRTINLWSVDAIHALSARAIAAATILEIIFAFNEWLALRFERSRRDLGGM